MHYSFLNLFNYARVDINDDGLKALVHLASGDMRKALNILQVKLISMLCNHFKLAFNSIKFF